MPNNTLISGGEKPGDLVTVESVTACRTAWSETMRAMLSIVLLSLILGLTVNLILVVEKKLVAEHLNDEMANPGPGGLQ